MNTLIQSSRGNDGNHGNHGNAAAPNMRTSISVSPIIARNMPSKAFAVLAEVRVGGWYSRPIYSPEHHDRPRRFDLHLLVPVVAVSG